MESLSLGPIGDLDPYHTRVLTNHPLSENTRKLLGKLSTVVIGLDGFDRPDVAGFEQFSPFINLHNTRKLEANGIFAVGDEFLASSVGQSPVTELVLCDSRVSAKAFEVLL